MAQTITFYLLSSDYTYICLQNGTTPISFRQAVFQRHRFSRHNARNRSFFHNRGCCLARGACYTMKPYQYARPISPLSIGGNRFSLRPPIAEISSRKASRVGPIFGRPPLSPTPCYPYESALLHVPTAHPWSDHAQILIQRPPTPTDSACQISRRYAAPFRRNKTHKA